MSDYKSEETMAKKEISQAIDIAVKVNLLAIREFSDKDKYRGNELCFMIIKGLQKCDPEELTILFDKVKNYFCFELTNSIINSYLEGSEHTPLEAKVRLNLLKYFAETTTKLSEMIFFEFGEEGGYSKFMKEGAFKALLEIANHGSDNDLIKLDNVLRRCLTIAYDELFTMIDSEYKGVSSHIHSTDTIINIQKLLSMELSFMSKEVYIDTSITAKTEGHKRFSLEYEKDILNKFNKKEYGDSLSNSIDVAIERVESLKERRLLLGKTIERAVESCQFRLKHKLSDTFKNTYESSIKVVRELDEWAKRLEFAAICVCEKAFEPVEERVSNEIEKKENEENEEKKEEDNS